MTFRAIRRCTSYANGPELGELSSGFKESGADWDWPLEKYGGHLFTKGYDILRLTEEIGAGELFVVSPAVDGDAFRMSQCYNGGQRLRDLLRFPHLTLPQKLQEEGAVRVAEVSPAAAVEGV